VGVIECKDILALCDRFESYLLPHVIKVLRLRYNGKTLMSPKTVGKIIGLSGENTRRLEKIGLRQLSHCLDLEANGQAITTIRYAKCFKQPTASLICRGVEDSTTAAAYTSYRGELIIHASRVPPEPPHDDLPLGALIGRVLLVDCFRLPLPHLGPHKWMLVFEQPETFEQPIPYAAAHYYFHLPTDISQQLPPRYPFAC
jgi:hypothetical protein